MQCNIINRWSLAIENNFWASLVTKKYYTHIYIQELQVKNKIQYIELTMEVILTREWYREDFRCVCATRRRQARGEGCFIDNPAQRLHLDTYLLLLMSVYPQLQKWEHVSALSRYPWLARPSYKFISESSSSRRKHTVVMLEVL